VEAVAVAREHRAPLLSRGGGTSLAGQCTNAALVIDWTKYCHRVESVDADTQTCVVQPGIVLDELNRQLAVTGLRFGPEPATHPNCTIGGMIGNNSCGATAQRTGKVVDNIRRMEVLLPDGTRFWCGETSDDEYAAVARGHDRRAEIYRQLRALRDSYADAIRRRFPDIPRRVSGYNLDSLLPEHGFDVAGLLVGSESTLVTVLRAELELVPVLDERTLVVLGYPDIATAADAVPSILPYEPVALEGVDRKLIRDEQQLTIALGQLKAIFDPEGRMNPGKVVAPHPLDDHMRIGADWSPADPEDTHFRYPHDGGSFAQAANRCVGVGKCRQHVTDKGAVMCPSYQVTLEEEHSTRGRARLLFEMLDGRGDSPVADGWRSEAVKDALDLCLACKGCKTNCPANVDMATYKAEFLSHHYAGRQWRRPRSDLAMGWLPAVANVVGRLRLGPAVNTLTHAPLLHGAAVAAAGVADREVPLFAGETLQQWFARRGPRSNGTRGTVLLWPDTTPSWAGTPTMSCCGGRASTPRTSNPGAAGWPATSASNAATSTSVRRAQSGCCCPACVKPTTIRSCSPTASAAAPRSTSSTAVGARAYTSPRCWPLRSAARACSPACRPRSPTRTDLQRPARPPGRSPGRVQVSPPSPRSSARASWAPAFGADPQRREGHYIWLPGFGSTTLRSSGDNAGAPLAARARRTSGIAKPNQSPTSTTATTPAANTANARPTATCSTSSTAPISVNASAPSPIMNNRCPSCTVSAFTPH
jgi:NAD-dependent dihydropyrimidine dehydrogenase PreA subunit